MQTRDIATFDEFLKLRTPWEELHRAAKGTLFQHPDWLAIWWETYGSTRRLKVSTYWSDGLLVGIIPAFTDTRVLARLKFRRASFLGEFQVHGEYSPLVESSCSEKVALQASSAFVDELEDGSVDILDFRAFPPESTFMQSFLSGLRGKALLRYNPESYPHIVAEGYACGETYLKSLSPGRRRLLGRSHRRMVEAGAEIEVVTNWGGGKPFEDLVRLHTVRWNYVGQPGRLSRRRYVEFLQKVTERLMATENARIYLVRFKGEPVAASLVYNVDRRRYAYVNGRNPTHELMHYSVGDVLTLRLMTDAFDAGCDCFDLMGGDYPYKHFFGTAKRWYARATATAAGVKGAKGLLYLGALAARDALGRVKRVRQSVKQVVHGELK